MSVYRPVVYKYTTNFATDSNLKSDNYSTKLVKYIPSESITLYTAVRGIGIDSDEADRLFFQVIFFGVLFLTPLWMYFATKDNGRKYAIFHASVASVAFTVWVSNFGDIFEIWFKNFSHMWAAIILTFVTAIIPVLENFIFPKDQDLKISSKS